MPEVPRAKRRVKNPESFREKAQKANEQPKVSRRSSVVRLLGIALRPLGAGLRSLFTATPLKYPYGGLRVVLRFIIPSYFKNSWRELKLVTWPNLRQSRALTLAVLIFAVVFGGAVALVDTGLDKLFKALVLK